jgi:serine/threonine protein kinase
MTMIASGDRVGKYRIVRTIHPGASAVVYEVELEGTIQHFALKMMLPSSADDREARRSFGFEARMGIELRHPNLLRVHEYITNEAIPYFVMDYFSSYNLKIPIARSWAPPYSRSLLHRIVTQTATSLAYLHDKGWVHRDVKPENVLANRSGEVRLIDFALAKRISGGFRKLFASRPPREGTRTYISPEQIRREPPTISADIYSFGITCYELVCGRPPFRANSSQELLSKHLSERAAPLTMHNKHVTTEFNDLVMKMIQKRPQDRLENLHEFLSRFRGIRIYQDDPAPQASRGPGSH